jgi:hypothetical protein
MSPKSQQAPPDARSTLCQLLEHTSDPVAPGSFDEPASPHHVPVELLVLAVLAILVLGLLLYCATIPIVWYLAAAALFFSGLIGPALGCLVLGGLASLFALARSN